MGQLPTQGGFLAGGVTGGAAPGQPPGRLIQRVEQRTLPDGRVLEFVYLVQTFATPDRTYVTLELLRGPQLCCSCHALDPSDVFCCKACSAIVCTRHAITCMACGVVVCSACAEGIHTGSMRAIVCRVCARAMRGSWFVRACRALSSLLWE